MPLIEDYHKEVARVVAEDYHKAVAQIIGLEARIDDLSRAYAVQGLALEEMAAERDRYREALRPFAALDPYKWGSEERVAILAARAALWELTK